MKRNLAGGEELKAPARWKIQLFGQLRAETEDRVVARFPTQKTAALLAYLAYHPERAHPREKLIDLLWPDSERDTGRNSFNVALSALRRLLEPSRGSAGSVLLTDRFSARLNPAVVVTDVAEFEAALQSAQTAAKEGERIECLTRAVELYRGELLPGYYEDWIPLEQERLAESYLQALARLIVCLEEAGEWDRAIGHARQWSTADPLNEEAHRGLMRLLAAAGEPTAALRHYRQMERILKVEIGAPPSEASRVLAGRIEGQRSEAAERSAEANDRSPAIRAVAGLPPPGFPALPTPHPHNLPQPLTSFIGREREREEIQRLLGWAVSCQLSAVRDDRPVRTDSRPPGTHGVGDADGPRLLTLTGSGGCGKTRLALAIGSDLLDDYPDGVWLVELAPLADPALVPQTAAAALGLVETPGRTPIQTLTEFLKPRQLLLVLDNCEHLIGACAHLAEALLQSCPHLRILATSREPLRIGGEAAYRVPSLSLPSEEGVGSDSSVPNTEHPTPSTLSQSEAVRLFIERATTALPTFRVTPENAGTVAQVCRRLDGIPLAIELAAARLRALPVEQIAARLDDMFRLLVGGSRTALPRHQTLRALIDWSYNLLTDAEQALLQRLSVFAGGCTLEAAEAVCSDFGFWIGSAKSKASDGSAPSALAGNPKSKIQNAAVLDLLTQLVEKSLVVYEERGAETRYRLLETMREYARERLLEAGEEAVVRGRHLEFFLGLAQEARLKLTSEPAVWLARLEVEQDNVRAALAWSLASPGAGEAGMRLAHALWGYWYDRGVSEGREWLRRLLEQSQGTATAVRAGALEQAGALARDYGDLGAARALLEEGLALSRELGDRGRIAGVLHNLGKTAFNQGDDAVAESLLEESVVLWRELGEKSCLLHPLFSLGDLAQERHEYALARSLFGETLTIARDLGDRSAITWSLRFLGNLAWQEGDYPAARALLDESLTLLRGSGFKTLLAGALMDRGLIAYSEQEYVAARAFSSDGLAIVRETSGNVDVGSSAARLERFARLAATQGQEERSVRLFGAAEALRASIAGSLSLNARAEHERHLAAARAALGEPAFAAAWEEGRAMSLKQAVAFALEGTDQT